MNKTITSITMLLCSALLCASCTNALEQEQAATLGQRALELMKRPPPPEPTGRNMWPALMTIKRPHLTPQERQVWADDFIIRI